MAELETSTSMPSAPLRRKWPLAGVVWIDLLIVALVVIFGTTIIQIIFLTLNARAAGLSYDAVRKLPQNELIGLIGVRGIFVSTLVQNLIFVAIPMIRIGFVRRESLATLGFTLKSPLRNLAIGVGVGVLALVLNIGLSALFSRVLHIEQNQSDQFAAFLPRNDLFGQLLFVVLAVILAPIGEETLFRGYLFNALRSPGGRTWLIIAYIVSAGIFSIIHITGVTQGAVALLVPLFIVGLLLAATVHVTGSLYPAMIAHAMNNSVGAITLVTCIQIGIEHCQTK